MTPELGGDVPVLVCVRLEHEIEHDLALEMLTVFLR